MRIGFAGASGTGKTKIATWTASHFGLPMNPIGSRSVAAAMGLESPYDADAAGRRGEFQARLLAEKVEWERAHEAFVTDRTTVDNLAYQALHDVRSIDSAMWGDVYVSLRRYDVIFVAPVESFYLHAGDPHRVNDITYHHVYEATLRGLLRRLLQGVEGPYMQVLCEGDFEARKKRVIDVVQRRPWILAQGRREPVEDPVPDTEPSP